MSYIENPKLKGSGILACIPQEGRCPINCPDCFFQGGRSYLEPLEENVPNMPPVKETKNRVVRVNDGNDSNNQREMVMEKCKEYELKFYNTSIPKDLHLFNAPVVLTVNPGDKIDESAFLLSELPVQLMYVRVRVNTWNLENVVDKVVEHYTAREIPVVLTFMAYYNLKIPEKHKKNYIFRKRTLNYYWAITTAAWEEVMNRYRYNIFVYSCGKIEGELGDTRCSRCGTCLREFFQTRERLANSTQPGAP